MQKSLYGEGYNEKYVSIIAITSLGYPALPVMIQIIFKKVCSCKV